MLEAFTTSRMKLERVIVDLYTMYEVSDVATYIQEMKRTGALVQAGDSYTIIPVLFPPDTQYKRKVKSDKFSSVTKGREAKKKKGVQRPENVTGAQPSIPKRVFSVEETKTEKLAVQLRQKLIRSQQ